MASAIFVELTRGRRPHCFLTQTIPDTIQIPVEPDWLWLYLSTHG